MPKRPRPIVLTVLDGWGYRAETKGNAIALARKPNYDRLLKEFPNTLIHTSGPYVGLPEGQMGNSEVGHMNIGAGRIVHMDITRVDQLIASGEFFRQPLLLEAMERGRSHQLHLMGLLSDGGVHSHIEHLFALLRMARESKVQKVFVHCFMDGRDTPPESGLGFLRQLEQKMREFGVGQIASISGRYYAMDRDNRWERIEKAYRAMVHGDAGAKFADPMAAIRASYEKGVTDEFVVPVVITTRLRPAARPFPRDYSRRRRGDLLQFSRRPRPPDDSRAHRACIHWIRGCCPAEKSRVRGHDAVRQNLALASLSPRLRKNSSTSSRKVFAEQQFKNSARVRKRRNTRTSPISSMAASRSLFPAKSASWCLRRKFPPTI